MHAGNVDETSNPTADIPLPETDDEVSNPFLLTVTPPPDLAAGVTVTLTESESAHASSVPLHSADPDLAHTTDHQYSNPEIVEKINSVFHEDHGDNVPMGKMEAFHLKLAAEWPSDDESMDSDFAWSSERESDASVLLSDGTSVLEGASIYERSTNLPQPLQPDFIEQSSHVRRRPPPQRLRPSWLHLRSGGEADTEVTASLSHIPLSPMNGDNLLGPRSPVIISPTPEELQIFPTPADPANEAITDNRTFYPVPEDVEGSQTHHRTPPMPNSFNHPTLPPDKS